MHPRYKPVLYSIAQPAICARPLLLAEQASEETWLNRVVLVTLATLVRGNPGHYLVDMLTAASPGDFSALTAGNLTAHGDSLG